MLRVLTLGSSLLSLLLVAAVASAAPPMVHHEGLLLAADGTPTAGAVNLRFALYPQAVGGIALWFEDYQLDLVDGYYSVDLGSQTPLDGVELGQDLYLGISVDHAAELAPRHRWVSVPYALEAENVTGDIRPNSVWVGGQQVIDDGGNWVGPPVPGAGDGVGYDTPEEVLGALLSVDGAGSGVDADTVDGVDSTQFVRGAAQVIALLLTVDGSGSGLDADRLDGHDSSEFVRTGAEALALLRDVDGAGSLLDADRLDGLDSTQFLRTDRDGASTGSLALAGSLSVAGTASAAAPLAPEHLATKAYVDAAILAGGGGGAADLNGRSCPEGSALQGFALDGSFVCTDVRPPVVLGCEPGAGDPAGGDTILVRGGLFRAGARVFFGDAEARSVQFLDAGTLRVVTPAGVEDPRGVTVTVLNPSGLSGNLSPGFLYDADVDDDGALNPVDCAPWDPNIYPGRVAPDNCDGVDEDCDGRTDEDHGLAACATGNLGVCDIGELRCIDGVVVCAQLEPASPEVCDRRDNDCDGGTDEDLNCVDPASCYTILQSGGSHGSGTYTIDPDGQGPGVPYSVYCEMSIDGGGWTLVGNTRTNTFDDASSAYYDDLARAVPNAAHVGIWNGLRGLVQGGRSDVRFTCRTDVNAGPHTVDLSFYDVPWYMEFTTGSDAQSCFSEMNGAGDENPPPARRNNVNGAFLPLGNQWNYGYLEGEDSCGDTGDFTVDFDDRGMDNNQTDGTDWGEDDGSRKCGNTYPGNGQWQVWLREVPTR